MKNQLNKILKVTFVIIFFTISKSYAVENVSEFTDAISEARDEFNNISEATNEQSKIIDEAIKEIDKATEYVQDAINNNSAEDAIKTLEFIEKSLSDVESIIPQEFSSDMSNIDTTAMSKEDMEIITEMTTQMNVAKEKTQNDFMSDLVDLNLKGIDTVSISENLDGLGINTIKLVLDVEGAENLEKWTKEQWADSYKGDILTSVGDETITDKEIGNKVVDLEQQLQTNNAAILDKRTSLSELQTKIDPLSNEITDLQTQKSSLLANYNEEILKQSSTILSDEEIGQSKELADQFNKQLSDITNEIKAAEEQSNSLQLQVQGLNLELTNEIDNKTQLENNIRDLSNQLSANQNVLSQKSSELNQLKNTDLNIKINSLNEQLQYASRERDFIQVDFERSIDLEVDATEMYYSALGNIDSDYYDDEVNFSIREVSVIMDSDPRKHRAFEIEKYATYAGFSDDYIQKGIQAINNDDWDKTKEMYKEITKKLSENSEWVVDTPSNAEINVWIEEEKAIQAAALASMEVDKIKSEWNAKINEEVKDIQPLAALNLQTIKSAATWEGMKEHSFLVEETNKLLSDANLDTKYAELEKAQQAYNEYMNKDWRAINYEGYSLTTALELQNKKNEILWDAHTTEATIKRQARENVYAAAEKAQKEYNQIISKENPELKAVEEKVTSILKEVPTFEKDAKNLAGLDPATLRARLVDITNGNDNETNALKAAREAVSKIGEAPVSEFMTGPYWEMTNVKAAAIVRSKKYSYVDDYEYINAYYEDRLNLNSADREYVESELKNLLSKDNVKLQALNNKVSVLSNELNFTQEQSQNITSEMAKLENELSSLKNSEGDLQKQINDLTNQFNSKESLIAEKTQNLASIQEQLNPISEKMNELQGQRAELDGKFNDQLNTIANQVKDQGQVSDEANVLKAEFESQIAELDNQIKEFENQSNEINSQLTTITTELSVLETENPEIANQIASLNQDLESFKDLKADLAMATAKKLGINVDEQSLKSVKIIDGKVVVSLEGTSLVSVVDKKMLIEDASKFIDTTSKLSVNTKVYTAGALNRELISQEFVEAAKSIAVSAKIDVLAQATAVEAVGATTEQSAKYATAKAARLAARKDWDAAMASGDKAAEQAAQAAWVAAKNVEQEAGLAAAAAVGASSAAASAAAAAAVTTEVAQAAASAAAEAVTTDVAQAAQEATKDAQQAALDALWALEELPGSSGMHTAEVTAAIRQLQAEMHGNEYSYLGASSYEEAMQKIAEAEAAGKTHSDLVREAGENADPNKMGKCGKSSC